MSTSSPRACKPTSTGVRRIRSRFATRNSARFACGHSEFTPITSLIRKSSIPKISGTRDLYTVPDLEGQLRNTIVGRMTDTFANSQVPFLDMAANQVALADKIAASAQAGFTELGLALDSFVVENLSLPDELQKILDQRIGMNMVGDMGRYTQFEVAQSIPIAAANEGRECGGRRCGPGRRSRHGPGDDGCAEKAGIIAGQTPAAPRQLRQRRETKFCMNCGKPIPKASKFCPECGHAQQ